MNLLLITNIKYILLVIDTEPPEINCVEDRSVETDAGKSTATVLWQTPMATDNSGETPTVTCEPESEINFIIGHTTVQCEAVDGSGNRAECNFNIHVTGDYQ